MNKVIIPPGVLPSAKDSTIPPGELQDASSWLRNFGTALLFLALVVIFWCLNKVELAEVLPLDHTVAQVCVFPLVIFLFFRLRVFGKKVPVLVLVLGLLLTTTSLVYAFYLPAYIGKSSILIARFAGDELQSETRIFREAINARIGQLGGIRSHSYYESIASLKMAREFLSLHPKIKMLVWGDRGWINIHFNERYESNLKDFGLENDFAFLGSLRIVDTPPLVGLGYKPTTATASFIANLTLGMQEINENIDYHEREIALLHAASVPAAWSTTSHRSFAWLKLGNLYLRNNLLSHDSLAANFDCAINSFNKGLSYYERSKHTELSIALLNNLAVTRYLQSVYSGKAKHRVIAFRTLTAAFKKLKFASPSKENLLLRDIIKSNLALIKEKPVKFLNSKKRKRMKLSR